MQPYRLHVDTVNLQAPFGVFFPTPGREIHKLRVTPAMEEIRKIFGDDEFVVLGPAPKEGDAAGIFGGFEEPIKDLEQIYSLVSDFALILAEISPYVQAALAELSSTGDSEGAQAQCSR